MPPLNVRALKNVLPPGALKLNDDTLRQKVRAVLNPPKEKKNEAKTSRKRTLSPQPSTSRNKEEESKSPKRSSQAEAATSSPSV